eukprot:Awhi_evm1s1717
MAILISFGDIVLGLLASYGSSTSQAVKLIQFICILYAYLRLPTKGIYWDVLLLGATAGFLGRIIEECCRLITEHPEADPTWYCLLIIAEPFWIVYGFTIVVCNYLKLKTFIKRAKYQKALKIFIIVGFVVYAGLRLFIGIQRFQLKIIYNRQIWLYHFPALFWLFFVELVMSSLVIYTCHRKSKEAGNTNLFKILMTSNLFVLFLCDIIALLIAITVLASFYYDIFGQIIVPMNNMKGAFPLFLAVDSLVCKITAKQNKVEEFGCPTCINGDTNMKTMEETMNVNDINVLVNLECDFGNTNEVDNQDKYDLINVCGDNSNDDIDVKSKWNPTSIEIVSDTSSTKRSLKNENKETTTNENFHEAINCNSFKSLD